METLVIELLKNLDCLAYVSDVLGVGLGLGVRGSGVGLEPTRFVFGG